MSNGRVSAERHPARGPVDTAGPKRENHLPQRRNLLAKRKKRNPINDAPRDGRGVKVVDLGPFSVTKEASAAEEKYAVLEQGDAGTTSGEPTHVVPPGESITDMVDRKVEELRGELRVEAEEEGPVERPEGGPEAGDEVGSASLGTGDDDESDEAYS